MTSHHQCSDRTCMFCRATNSGRARSRNTGANPTVSAVATRELASWARLQDVQESLTKNQPEDLEQIALLDRATGLLNSRNLLKELGKELARARRSKGNVGICMISIGSDTEGDTRVNLLDNLYKVVANVVLTSIREVDCAGRYKMNQIAVVLPGSNAETSTIFADRLKVALDYELLQKQGLRGVNIHYAVGCFPANGTQKEELLERVGQALVVAQNGNYEIAQAQ